MERNLLKDLAELHFLNRSLLVGSELGQSLLDLIIMEMCHATICDILVYLIFLTDRRSL
jgi:hypothetical protein